MTSAKTDRGISRLERCASLRVLMWTKRNDTGGAIRGAHMPVVILWGLPVLIVLGGGVYLLTHLH